jgi:hypothetical protein
MTRQIDTGGPAFPQLDPTSAYFDATGMSLRDWFAGQAIRSRWGDGTAMTPEQAASMAYQLADAMLAEREADFARRNVEEAE